MRSSPPRLSAWGFVTWFGVVALLADLVYEGARSIVGPYLASLGAGAALVGAVTGAGEAFALIGRLGTGTLADRTRAYWPLTLAGYTITVVAVPLLGVAPVLWAAAGLVIVERAGKAVRGPAKDVMVSHAAAAVGRGRGFAVHEALDQVGAVAGPLLVAAVLAATADDYGAAFLVLAVPGAAVLALLVALRARVPDPSPYEAAAPAQPARRRHRPPRGFWSYLAFTMVTTTGFGTFGVLSYHLATEHVIPLGAVPLVYAAAMAVDALAALLSGWWYDRIGRRVLIAVPALTALVPLVAFTKTPALALTGALLWGAVIGITESTMRAAVADLVPTPARGTAYGVFAAGYGTAALAGGFLTGALYAHSVPALVITVAALQAAALALLLTVERTARARRI